MSKIQEFKSFAEHLAQESGKIIRGYFRTGIKVDSKKDSTPVTIADKKSEEIMRNEIMKKFPGHGILGEEFEAYNENAEYKWILDPIDGTISFICGTVTFGTLIALTKNDKPILGVINQPILNEFLIGDNSSCLLNGKPVFVRECNSLSKAILLSTDYLNIEKYQDINKFNELLKKVKIFRGWGDCYGYYLVATGYADIMIDPIMNMWDIMPLIPIIKGAGGVITDFNGNSPEKSSSIIASSKSLHPKILEILK